MATINLFPASIDGTSTGTVLAGTVSNLQDTIASPDGNTLDFDGANNENLTTILIMDDLPANADTITNITLHVRGRVVNRVNDSQTFTVGTSGWSSEAGTNINTGDTAFTNRLSTPVSMPTVAEVNSVVVNITGLEVFKTKGADGHSFEFDCIYLAVEYTETATGPSGDLDATEGADTATGSGDVVVQGDISSNEPTDVLASTGDVPRTGTIAATEQSDSSASTGDVVVQGDLTASEGGGGAATILFRHSFTAANNTLHSAASIDTDPSGLGITNSTYGVDGEPRVQSNTLSTPASVSNTTDLKAWQYALDTPVPATYDYICDFTMRGTGASRCPGFLIAGETNDRVSCYFVRLRAGSEVEIIRLESGGAFTILDSGPGNEYTFTGGTRYRFRCRVTPTTLTTFITDLDAATAEQEISTVTDSTWRGKYVGFRHALSWSLDVGQDNDFIDEIRVEEPPSGGTGDTFAASGTVTDAAITGTLAATEAPDTLSASGGVTVQGDIDATEQVDAAAFAGQVVVQGDIDATEAADVFAGSGATPNEGDLAATETPDTADASGAILIEADLDATESVDTASFTGDVVIAADLDATEAADTFAASGDVAVQGDIDATEQVDAAAFAGQVIVQGDIGATEQVDTFSASAGALTQGDLNATESVDTASFTGDVVVAADLDATEAADTFTASGDVAVQGDIDATEQVDAAAFAGQVVVQGDIDATEAADVFAGTGGQVITGNLDATETSDAFASDGEQITFGDLDATEQTDDASATGDVLVAGDLSANEQADQFSANAGTGIRGNLAATETTDELSANGDVVIRGDMVTTEAADVAAIVGELTPIATGDLNATETSDGFDASGDVPRTGDIAATERTDVAKFFETVPEPEVPAGGIGAWPGSRHKRPPFAPKRFTFGDVAASEASDGMRADGYVETILEDITGEMNASEGADGASVSLIVEWTARQRRARSVLMFDL